MIGMGQIQSVINGQLIKHQLIDRHFDQSLEGSDQSDDDPIDLITDPFFFACKRILFAKEIAAPPATVRWPPGRHCCSYG